jgi:hypothetical protein
MEILETIMGMEIPQLIGQRKEAKRKVKREITMQTKTTIGEIMKIMVAIIMTMPKKKVKNVLLLNQNLLQNQNHNNNNNNNRETK